MNPEDQKNDSKAESAGAETAASETANGGQPDAPATAGGETTAPQDPPEPPEPKEPTLEDQLEEARTSIAELKDKVLRAMAETENIRRRGAKEKRDTGQYAIANFARDLLPVADNLGRALDNLPEGAKDDPTLGGFAEGVELTGRELVAVFEKHGVKEVRPQGDKFDHNLHQAMFEVEDADKPHGTITEVMQIGYTIGERLLRPAMVGVTKAPRPVDDAPKTDEPAPETPQEDGEA